MTQTELHRASVDAVIFDLDGLLLNTELLYKRSWQRAAQAQGYELDDRLYGRLAGHSRADCDAMLVATFGATFPLEEFYCAWSLTWKELVRTGAARTKPYAIEILGILRAHAVPTAVASSSNREFVMLSLTEVHIVDEFRVIVAGDDVSRSKPAPDIYLEAARRLGVEATRCVALDDTEVGATAAVAAGMRTILIPDIVRPRQMVPGAEVVGSLRNAADLILQWLGVA